MCVFFVGEDSIFAVERYPLGDTRWAMPVERCPLGNAHNVNLILAVTKSLRKERRLFVVCCKTSRLASLRT